MGGGWGWRRGVVVGGGGGVGVGGEGWGVGGVGVGGGGGWVGGGGLMGLGGWAGGWSVQVCLVLRPFSLRVRGASEGSRPWALGTSGGKVCKQWGWGLIGGSSSVTEVPF